MKPENKGLVTKYVVSFAVASLITFVVFWIKGFFTDSVSVNIQILSDAFSIAGIVFLFLAGMMYVSGEGALIGMGFILNGIVQWFVPMGRKYHESYADYRERKIGKIKSSNNYHFLVIGLVFFLIGVTFTIIWYTKFYK